MDRNENIDILKLLACFGVVVIHAGNESYWDQITFNFFQISVPLFFLITGYFYLSLPIEHVLKHIKKIFKIAVLATVYCLGVFVLVYGRDFYEEISQLGKITAWYSFLVFNEPFYGFHLWYLWSIIYVLILLYYIPKKLLWNQKLVCTLTVILFLLNSTIGLRFFLINALPYVLTGIILSLHKETLRMLKGISIPLFLFFIFYVLGYFKIPLLNYGYFAIPVFILFLSLPLKGKLCSKLAWCGKNCSLGVYIIHPLVLTLLKEYIPGGYPFGYALIATFLLILLINLYIQLKKYIYV